MSLAVLGLIIIALGACAPPPPDSEDFRVRRDDPAVVEPAPGSANAVDAAGPETAADDAEAMTGDEVSDDMADDAAADSQADTSADDMAADTESASDDRERAGEDDADFAPLQSFDEREDGEAASDADDGAGVTGSLAERELSEPGHDRSAMSGPTDATGDDASPVERKLDMRERKQSVDMARVEPRDDERMDDPSDDAADMAGGDMADDADDMADEADEPATGWEAMARDATAAGQSMVDDLPPDDPRARFDLQPLPRTVPFPADNPPVPERIALGRHLFFDPVLGGEQDVSCATCHHPSLAWADGRRLGLGVAGGGPHGHALGPDRVPGFSAVTGDPIGLEPRNSPTVLNTAFNGKRGPAPRADSFQFWDGRVEGGLDEQVLKPPTSREEMAGDAYGEDEAMTTIVRRLREIDQYERLFRQAFDEEPLVDGSAITQDRLGRAIGAFERTLITPDAPYDRYIEGEDDALTPAQLRGLELFFGEANCSACHMGPMLSDFDFHIQGAGQIGPGRPATPGDDTGRYEVTGEESDRYAFRTPTLRNVALTAPYMHDGSVLTLRGVMAFYNRGGNDVELPDDIMDEEIFPLGLTDREMDDLVAFMDALTGEQPDVAVPDRVPSGLEPVFGRRAER